MKFTKSERNTNIDIGQMHERDSGIFRLKSSCSNNVYLFIDLGRKFVEVTKYQIELKSNEEQTGNETKKKRTEIILIKKEQPTNRTYYIYSLISYIERMFFFLLRSFNVNISIVVRVLSLFLVSIFWFRHFLFIVSISSIPFNVAVLFSLSRSLLLQEMNE